MTEPEFTTEELANEEWRDIPNTNGRYQVSSLGRIRSIIITYLNPTIKGSSSGYARASLYNGKSRTPHVKMFHHLVAENFIGPRPEGQYVNHIDANKLNNRASNLEYVTPAQNTQHASEMGLLLVGEEHKHSKLTAEKVREIIEQLADGESTYKIAEDYGVSKVLICNILRGKNWRHVPRPDHPRFGDRGRGKGRYGEDSMNAKLTEENVRELRQLYASGEWEMRPLAAKFGIGLSQVKRIIDRTTWRHVD